MSLLTFLLSKRSATSAFNRIGHRWFSSISSSCKEQIYNDFNKNGFIIVRNLFDKQEINILRKTIETDKIIEDVEYTLADNEGGKASLIIWRYLDNDTFGNFLQSKRLLDIIKIIWNVDSYNDIQHYHSKLNRKHAKIGGSFMWHQDYGYWYQNGLLFPDLCTTFIAVDKCTKQNGCLQILKGSHLMGRLEHNMINGTGQHTIDDERLLWIENECEKVYCELNEGDTIFTHCNLLHTSDQNKSDKSRMALLGCYNKSSNTVYKQHHHFCTNVNAVNDDQIKKMGVVTTKNKDIFMNPHLHKDETVVAQTK